MESIEYRLSEVRKRVSAACARAGRRPAEVEIVAVSKGVGPDAVTEAAGAGLRLFGESRVREASSKMRMCPGNLEWHLVGHLQTNKAKDAARMFAAVHSADSVRVLEALDSGRDVTGLALGVYIQVNVSGESAKYGCPEDELESLLKAANALSRIEVRGLMTIPPFTPDAEDARPVFRKLRELRDRTSSRTGLELHGLSMGMSHDFEVAIEEGATVVRLGSVLFG
jgi:pyridoxal phosphate enzyme (YggS family)